MRSIGLMCRPLGVQGQLPSSAGLSTARRPGGITQKSYFHAQTAGPVVQAKTSPPAASKIARRMPSPNRLAISSGKWS